MSVRWHLAPWVRADLTAEQMDALRALAPDGATVTVIKAGGPRGEVMARVGMDGRGRLSEQRGFDSFAVTRRALTEAVGFLRGPHPLDRFLVHEPIGRLSQGEPEPPE